MKVKIKPSDIQCAAKSLTRKLKPMIQDKNIYLVGINRGGIIPLGYLSYFLNTRNTRLVDINLYPDEHLREIKKSDIRSTINQLQWINYLTDKDIVIFVDDLFDTGSTFKVIDKSLERINHKHVIYSCLFGRDNTLSIIYGKKKPDGWLVFPWDEKI